MPDNQYEVIKVGSRESQLALIQTQHVVDELKKKRPGYDFEIGKISKINKSVEFVTLFRLCYESQGVVKLKRRSYVDIFLYQKK